MEPREQIWQVYKRQFTKIKEKKKEKKKSWAKFEKKIYKKNQFKAQLVQNGKKGTEIDRVDQLDWSIPNWTECDRSRPNWIE